MAGQARGPAKSKQEAVSRVEALVGGAAETLGPGSTEHKATLVRLAERLALDVDTRLDKPALGAQIAQRLGAEWDQHCWSAGSTVTLTGLNTLLLAAEAELERREEAAGHDGFGPALTKLEAVTRMSALVDGEPESIGPGGKEHKSALVQLALGLGLAVDTSLSKPELGAAMAVALGRDWPKSCWSAGDTVTLAGLNTLLEGAEAEARHRGASGGTT